MRILPLRRTLAPAFLGLLAVAFAPTIIPAAAPMGPLKVHPENPRYFATPDHRAVWLTGSHTWAALQERGLEGETPDFDYDRFLDFMQQHGHNFLRLWVWEHAQWMQFSPASVPVRYKPPIFQRPGPGLALDGQPKFDLTRFNDAFFTRLRARVLAAQRRGLYVSVMFFQGFSAMKTSSTPNRGNNWHGNPFNRANNINGLDGDPAGQDTGHQLYSLTTPAITRIQEGYVRRVIDTLNDLDNVLWEIGNELPAESVEFQYHMIQHARACEADRPKQHLIGMTGAPVGTPALMASPADWVSPPGSQWLTNPPPADGSKLMVIDTDHCRALKHDPTWVWNNFTRGHHFILMDLYLDFRAGTPRQPDPAWAPTQNAMGAARRLSERLDLAKMQPLPELASSGFCLAEPGQAWVIFQTGAAPITVRTGPGTWRAVWLDPIHGQEVSRVDTAASKEGVTVKPPAAGNWVLLVTASGRAASRNR